MIEKTDIVALDTHTHTPDVVDVLSARPPQKFRNGDGWVLPTICVTHSARATEVEDHHVINSGDSQSVCIEMDQRVDVLVKLAKTLLLDSTEVGKLVKELMKHGVGLKNVEKESR